MSTLFCGSCRQLAKLEDCSQLVPCLHTICLPCIQKQIQKCQVCPVQHCYSPLVQPADQKWNSCASETCQRKLSYAQDVATAICQHDLCGKCYDDALKADTPVCPVLNCNVLLKEEEREKCGGPCGSSLDAAKLQMLSCCGMRICADCVEKWTERKDCCPKGKCPPAAARTKKGKKISFAKIPCKGMTDCEGEVLRNFPNEQECEHACCLSCLGAILKECEQKGCPPICPNESCRLPYRCETVLCLKAHFPERAAYFNRFDLDSHFSMEALKDDMIKHIYGKGTEVIKLTEIKIGFCEEDDNQQTMEFDLENGTLGDLLRELRRILKMPWDKVYGYFRRDFCGNDQLLQVKQKTIHTPLSQLKITKDTLILVDFTGIVNKRKSSAVEQKKPSKKSHEILGNQ